MQVSSATFIFLLFSSLLHFTSLFAQDRPNLSVGDNSSIRLTEHPQVIVSVLPEQSLTAGVYEQGQLVVTLRVASKFPFDALSINFPPIEGVEQIELAPPRTRKVTSYAGEGFVHERSFALFPRNPGSLIIPTVDVQGLLAVGQKRQTAFTDTFAGFTIPINPKPATYDDEWWMVSSNVDLEESWSKPLEELHEGDIVTRTITLRAVGVNAPRLPELEHSRTRGIAVRELDTTVKTVKSAQGLTGILTKSWSLKIEGSNVVYISPVGVAYWHPLEQKRMKIAVAGHRIEPLKADSELIAKRLLDEAIEKQQVAYKLTFMLSSLVLLPLVVLIVYSFVYVFSFYGDYRFSRLFNNAGNGREAYRVWLEWSLPQKLQSSEQWQSVNRNLQYTVFSEPDHLTQPPTLNRRDTVRHALRCARCNRLNKLREKFHMSWDFIFGQRSVL